MNYIGIDGKVHNDVYLMHFNPYHDKLGRFASRSGGGGVSRSNKKIPVDVDQNGRNLDPRTAQIRTRINKIDNKTGKLQVKSAKYKEKSAKYNRKANKIKRMATNPLIGRTDFREAANYASLRAEGKGLKYAHKAEKLNKKISKLNREKVKLGLEYASIKATTAYVKFNDEYYEDLANNNYDEATLEKKWDASQPERERLYNELLEADKKYKRYK